MGETAEERHRKLAKEFLKELEGGYEDGDPEGALAFFFRQAEAAAAEKEREKLTASCERYAAKCVEQARAECAEIADQNMYGKHAAHKIRALSKQDPCPTTG